MLRQGRNPRQVVHPLTGLVLGCSSLAKKPCTHAFVAQYLCAFGSKQPSPLSITGHTSQGKLESYQLSKGAKQDLILFANLNRSIPNTPSLLSSRLECYLSVLANNCGTGSLQDFHIYSISTLILTAKTTSTRQSYLVVGYEQSLC
jgi:hypothetical protein